MKHHTTNKAGNNIFMTSTDPNATINLTGEEKDEDGKVTRVKIDFHALNKDQRYEYFRIKSAK